MARAFVRAAVLIAAGAVAGCGENPTSPTANQLPFVGQFAGAWSGATVPVRVFERCLQHSHRSSGSDRLTPDASFWRVVSAPPHEAVPAAQTR